MTPNLNLLWARAILQALHASGARRICISPGSRSAPLALAARPEDGWEISVHLDERSAAFFALGIAKATGAPAVLLSTSGTAAANYLPAVVEASRARVPLVVLTADRPPEARGAGAPQTIDQIHLYGRHARSFHDLPLPEADLDRLRAASAIAAHAVWRARCYPEGPVHLNVPMREPLSPALEEPERVAELEEAHRRSYGSDGPPIRIGPPPIAAAAPEAGAFFQSAIDARAPLIVAGPESDRATEPEGILALSEMLLAPILADVASGVRFVGGGCGRRCAHGDLFLRSASFASKPPDLVIRFGETPTSRAIQENLRRHRPAIVQIREGPERSDPDALTTRIVPVPAGNRSWWRDLGWADAPERADSPWLRRFVVAERLARSSIERDPLPIEPAAIRGAAASAPSGSALFLSNSLPIRHAETFLDCAPEGTRVFASRGANGIDGIVSTALGTAMGSGRPLLAVVGDLAYLHDLSGLRACRLVKTSVVILLLNNDGGGIFSHLPIAGYPERFEELFGTPHGCDLASASSAFGLRHTIAESPSAAGHAVEEGFRAGGASVVEVRSNRVEEANRHREWIARTIDSLDREIQRGGS